MTTPNRPPSCDRLNPELKECPFCGSEDVELRDGYDLDQINHYVRCNECEADGPWHDDTDANKWNSIPRRSEVLELLRLVDEVTVFGRALIDTRNFPDAGSFMVKDLEQLKAYANKLRKEIGE